MDAFLLDADFMMENKLPSVRLLLKGREGKSFRAFDYSFEPYFYLIPSSSLEEAKKLVEHLSSVQRDEKASVKRVEIVEKQLRFKNVKLLKVIANNPGHVPVLREECRKFGEVYEADIPFVKRYLFDKLLSPCGEITFVQEGMEVSEVKPLDSGEPLKLNTLALDIETYNPSGLPNPEKDPCLMASYYADGGISGVYSHSKHFQNDYTKSFRGEKEMLEAICGLLRRNKVDLLCTYNGDAFDLPYLQVRARKLNADFRLGRDKGHVKTRKQGLRMVSKIGGRIHYDVFPVVSFLNFIGTIKVQRLTLEKVYEEVLGGRKLDVKKFEIWKTWDSNNQEDLEHLAEYCRIDSKACYELTKHFLHLQVEMSKLTGLTLFETCRATASQLVEALLIRKAFLRNELVPNKPHGEEIQARVSEPIQGAFVKVPNPGIYDNIAVLDFKSLYPSIIISHNIDAQTIDCDCCNEKEAFLSPQGYKFCSKNRGIVPSMLEEVLSTRFKIQGEMKKLDKESEEYKQLFGRQWGLKILANSVAADEPIILLSPENEVVVKTASEFVDPLLREEFVWATQLGDATGWKVASFNALGSTEFKAITKVMRHECNSLLSFTLSSGREASITKDHSVFSLNAEGEIIPVPGCDIHKGSLVLVPKKMPSPNVPPKMLNLMKSLLDVPENELEDVIITIKLDRPLDMLEFDSQIISNIIDDRNISRIASELSLDRHAVGDHLRYLLKEGIVQKSNDGRAFIYSLTEKAKGYGKFLEFSKKLKYNGNKREHFAFFNEVKSTIQEICEDYLKDVKIGTLHGSRVSPFFTINEEVASLLGYYVSEGCSRKWLNQTNGFSYRVDIANYDQKVLDFTFNAFKALGFNASRSLHSVCVNSKNAYLLFKYLFKCGGNAYEKSIPSIILSSTPEIKLAFLKTYFEGDGNYEKHAKRWRFTTVSKRLVTDLVLLLNQLGISAVSIKKDSRFYRIVVNEPLFFGERKLWRTFAFNIPGMLLENEIKSLGRKQFYYHLNGGMHKKALQRFYDVYKIKLGESKKIERLMAFLNSDLAVDRVIEVREETPNGFVYDLSVQGNESFIGGNGLICLHNSMYGYLLYARSRYYTRKGGEATTAWARQYIQETIQKAEGAGFIVLYADTDSVFLQLKSSDEIKVNEFRKKINSELPKGMELELEDFYPRGIFVSKKQGTEKGAKKKYALINKEGKIKIRGFELVRRDWSRVARETQRKVLSIVLKEGDVEKAVKLVKGAIEELKGGKVPLDELVVYTQLRKKASSYEVTSPEVSAFEKARKQGLKLSENSVIGYVITRDGKSTSEKAQLIELAKNYDPDYYVNKQVIPAVLKILGALGYSEEDLKLSGKQTGLGAW